MKTLVLLFHGSRGAEARSEAELLAATIRARLEGVRVVHAFLQLGAPSLPSTIDEAIGAGAKRIDVLPLFVLVGAHVLRDVPAQVETARARHPGTDIRLLRHLGADPRFHELLVALAGPSRA
jgi:sirohydrochlorin ferrochelatase